MMRTVIALLGTLGCASSTQYQIAHSPTLPWTRANFVQQEFAQDRHDCLHEASSEAHGDCDHHFGWLRCDPMSAEALFKACMESKGYVLRR